MTEMPRTQDEAHRSDADGRRPGRRIAPALLMIAQGVGFVALVGLLLSGHLLEAMWVFQFVLAAGMLLAVLWAGARRRRVWNEPLARLEALLPEVREGREPIEALAAIGGRLAPLAGQIRELLRELRQERSSTKHLREEIRQRVASRTEGLERTIGALRQQAARDPLTGLFNRRMLDAYLPEAIERCKAEDRPLCLLMIDVDHFKQLNDSLGHPAGDDMLRSLAQIIRSTIGEADIAFRCGGDEFVVVLEGCDDDAGRALAARLSSLADALGRTFHLACPPRLSIGISSLSNLRELSAAALWRQADEALYQIKAEHHIRTDATRRSA